MSTLSPDLMSVAALHAKLGIGNAEAKFLSRHVRYRYRAAQIPKRRGGNRTLLAPDDRLKFHQRELLDLLTPLYRSKPAVHGFVADRSPITNANAHQGRPYLLNLDLSNYFGAITRNRVKGVLIAVGIPTAVAESICDLTVVDNQLPQGAPTSPLLANMVTFRLDKDLTAFAKTHRLRYTRYADDITFSSYVRPTVLFVDAEPFPGRIDISDIAPALSGLITGNNFSLNPDKARYCAQKTRKQVTGLVVNEFTNVRRDFVRNVRSSLYRMETLGLNAAELEYQAKYGSKSQISSVVRGRLEWIAQVRGRSFDPYRVLAARFNLLYPDSPLRIDPTNEEILDRAIFVVEYGKGKKMSQGSAFFLDGVGLVTAHHVLAKMPSGWATLYRAASPTIKYQARMSSKACSHRDLAILEHNVPTHEQAFLKQAAGVDRIKATVTVVGYPDFGPGDNLIQKQGRIVGRNIKSAVRYVEVDMQVGDGLSGAPIINDRYEVVAVGHKGGPQESKQLGIDIVEISGL
ncbi:hypothetical protein GCM10009422_19200 [Brevundimonas kwangchunensis]|uniref:RNA-directed DNA polymerase n=1 Tax=Brevundimonas kwangchunensis TaxID=322163 RepID=A0ABN1GZ17_9CAUL